MLPSLGSASAKTGNFQARYGRERQHHTWVLLLRTDSPANSRYVETPDAVWRRGIRYRVEDLLRMIRGFRTRSMSPPGRGDDMAPPKPVVKPAWVG
jgi:hypothetical protein